MLQQNAPTQDAAAARQVSSETPGLYTVPQTHLGLRVGLRWLSSALSPLALLLYARRTQTSVCVCVCVCACVLCVCACGPVASVAFQRQLLSSAGLKELWGEARAPPLFCSSQALLQHLEGPLMTTPACSMLLVWGLLRNLSCTGYEANCSRACDLEQPGLT